MAFGDVFKNVTDLVDVRSVSDADRHANANIAGWAATFIEDLSRGDVALAGRLAGAIKYDLGSQRFHPQSPVIAGTPGEIAECLLPYLPGANPSSLINHMNITAAEAPQAEAAPLVPLLGKLRAKGIKLGVATTDAEMPARSHLHSAGIGDLFDFVSGSDSGHGAKPHPGPCLAFCQAVRVPPGTSAVEGTSS